MNVSWQLRRAGEAPAAIRHGLESRWPDSVAALLGVVVSATLLSRSGHEVIVVDIKRAGEGWSGTVAQVAAGEGVVRVGTLIEFGEENVQAGTYT